MSQLHAGARVTRHLAMLPAEARKVTATFLLAFAVAARAAETPGDNWVRIGASEAVGIGALLAADFIFEFSANAADPPRWRQPILFDEAVHGSLTAASATARARAGTLSDIGLYGLAALPLVVDAGLVTWLGRGNPGAAVQLALLDAQALALSWGLATLVERAVSRERPYVQNCVDPTRSACGGSANDRNTSFLSGHTTVAFTMAAVLCVEHTRLDLLGSADVAVCPIAATAAAATGVLRVVAERHWATDVLAGAALGTSIGAIVALVHVRPRASAGAPQFTPVAGPGSIGLAFGGPV